MSLSTVCSDEAYGVDSGLGIFFRITPNTSIPLPGNISCRPHFASPYKNFVKMLQCNL